MCKAWNLLVVLPLAVCVVGWHGVSMTDPQNLQLLKTRLRGSEIFEIWTDRVVICLGGPYAPELYQVFWDATAGGWGGCSNPEGVSWVMNRRNARQGKYVAKVLVEPELSSQLLGFRDEEKICQCYAPGISGIASNLKWSLKGSAMIGLWSKRWV